MPIPLIDVTGHRTEIGDRIDQAIRSTIASSAFIMGPEVAEFEGELARFCGAQHAIGCSNGTDALILALLAAGLRPGEAVIVPTFTFVATAEAVSILGGIPVFADCEPGGFNLSAESVAAAGSAALTAGLDVRAVIAVDLFGHAADYDALTPVAGELGAVLVADAAQSIGALTPGGPVGSLAAITTTSFFPAKPLSCYGDGGAVLTDDEETAATIRSLRVHGAGAFKYDNVRIGLNARLDTIQAAVLREKLRIFNDEIKARNDVAAGYEAGLAGVVEVPAVQPGHVPTWAQYTIVVDDRDGLADHLRHSDIGCAVYYPTPLHRQTAYRPGGSVALSPVPLARAEQLARRVLSIPMYPYLTHDEQDAVIASILAFHGA